MSISPTSHQFNEQALLLLRLFQLHLGFGALKLQLGQGRLLAFKSSVCWRCSSITPSRGQASPANSAPANTTPKAAGTPTRIRPRLNRTAPD